MALRTEELMLNMGPQHPSTHCVRRMVVTLDGENIMDVWICCPLPPGEPLRSRSQTAKGNRAGTLLAEACRPADLGAKGWPLYRNTYPERGGLERMKHAHN